jgi:pyruvate/2-oxoacid:ferredoxin oxidoreductase beta subunit
MTHLQALHVVARHRGQRVVLTTMTSVGVWPTLSDVPLDFHYIPSAMGQGPALGLGLALSQEGRGVIVLNGDGCTLMNLGCLVTLASNPADVYLVILDNALYEVTGGQPTAGAGRVEVVVWLRVEGRLGQQTPKAPRTMAEQINRLRHALGVQG